MLTIRLKRMGKKKVAQYRLIISEKARDTQDVYLENLGTYNPHAQENAFQPNAERITYWISKGAQASPTVHNLLVTAGLVKDKKVKSVFLTDRRKTKLGEKQKAREEAQAAAKAKAAEAAAAKAAAEEEAKAAAKAAAEAEKAAAEAAKAVPAEEAAPAPAEEKPAEPEAPAAA